MVNLHGGCNSIVSTLQEEQMSCSTILLYFATTTSPQLLCIVIKKQPHSSNKDTTATHPYTTNNSPHHDVPIHHSSDVICSSWPMTFHHIVAYLNHYCHRADKIWRVDWRQLQRELALAILIQFDHHCRMCWWSIQCLCHWGVQCLALARRLTLLPAIGGG